MEETKKNITPQLKESSRSQQDEYDNKIHANIRTARILIRGGEYQMLQSVGEPLLKGELVYGERSELNGLTLLKIGDGIHNWANTGVDENSELDDTVFYSGRGAGLRPAVMDDNKNSKVGGVRIHSSKPVNQKAGIQIDKDGFLHLWKDASGQTSLVVDKLKVTNFEAENSVVKNVTESDYITLREGKKTSLLDNEIAGIKVVKPYNDEDYYFGINSHGNWCAGQIRNGKMNYFKIAFLDENCPEGAVMLVKEPENTVANIPAHEVLKHWTVNSLSLKINKNKPKIYSPIDPDSANSFELRTLETVKIITKELNPETPTEDEFKVDEAGVLTIELPIVSGYSLDQWNSKVSDVLINENSVVTQEGNNKYIAHINVHNSTLNEEGEISAPIHKIFFNKQEQIPDESRYIHIQPDIYHVKCQGDERVYLTSKVSRDKENVTFNIKATHAFKTKIPSNPGETYYIGDGTNKSIILPLLSYDKWGHIDSQLLITYSFEHLLQRIEFLEKKIAELEKKK